VSDSSGVIRFEFNGKPVTARPGDTVASALFRSGQRIFSRSFKYHRPRGLLCLAGKCPNCMMNVDGEANVRTCVTPVREGMRVQHQHAWPSLENDVLGFSQYLGWLMKPGWYYKVFTNPVVWRKVEPSIRKLAGVGVLQAVETAHGDYEHAHLHTDVAIVGGGPAGLAAAAQLAGQELRVVLIDDQPALGGHLRYRKRAGTSPVDIARVTSAPNIQVLQGAYCFGLYEGNLLGVLQANPSPGVIERLIHLRAQRVIVATGASEAPLIFANNDFVGVMLSSAVQRMIHLHGVAPGRRAAVVAADARGTEIAEDLKEAGVEVAAVVRPEEVLAATGSNRVTGLRTKTQQVACDLIVVCGPQIPDAGLIAQAGGKLSWDEGRGTFVPTKLPTHVSAVGEVTGGAPASAIQLPQAPGEHAFVCLCSDVTARDVQEAIAEGFDSIETLKRYTTTSMGPCQGKMCQLSAIKLCAEATGRSMERIGTTVARPPNPAVTLGALAGARHHPVRRTPMHYEHEALGAVWLDMGQWKRPRYYKTAASSEEKTCVEGEYKAVRERVGLVDVTTLGKLDLKGKDAAKLLDKVYVSRFSDLKPGRVRYSFLCDDAGIMLDDGTVSCLADGHYFISTSTGNLEFVRQWLQWWAVGTGWDAHVTDITGGMAAVNLAGPKARDVLSPLTDCDLSPKAFTYMNCRQGMVAGVPAVLLRIGFVGETGWEIHVPAEAGAHVWKTLLKAGEPFGIQPFGVEAQRLLRLEKRHVLVGVDTDALTTPVAAGMTWAVKYDKEDFLGKPAFRRPEGQTSESRLVGFIMQEDVLPQDGTIILRNGKLAGHVTSVRYSPGNHRAVGLGWVPTEMAQEGTEIEVRVNGRAAHARITEQAFYDPQGGRLRM
jgi:sarcosine oxidase subunit alpha